MTIGARGWGDAAAGGDGVADAATGTAAWPGGAQSGGGTKALLGSPERTGDGGVTTEAGVATRLAGWAAAMMTGVDGDDEAAGAAADATTGAADWPGGAQPGGGTKALLGSPERTGGSADVGIARSADTAITAGKGVAIGAGIAVWPDGAQPGGGTNALLGSEGRAGSASEIAGAATGGAAIVVTTGGGGTIDVGTGAADATTGSTVRPGGAQPGGGTNALLGSPWGTGTTTGSGVAAGTVGGTTGGGSAAGALEIGATEIGAADGAAPAGGPPAGGSTGALLLVSFSAAVRAWRCSRALASRSTASFSAASFCAFWPPRPATMEPTCGPVRVSSTGAMLESYWRPVFAEGKLVPAATWASAPGRAFALCTGALLPNIPQPDRIANADTPTKPNHRPRPPIMSCSRCIVVTCLKPGSHTVSSGSREEI